MLLAQKTDLPEVSFSWAAGGSTIWQSWVSGIRSCRLPVAETSGQGVSSDAMKRGRAEGWEGVARREAPSVMGPSPWTSTEDVFSTDIHCCKCKVVLKADWLRLNIKALLSSCSRSKGGAQASKIPYLCCGPWSWLCIWRKDLNDGLKWLGDGGWAHRSLSHASWCSKWVISDGPHQAMSFFWCKSANGVPCLSSSQVWNPAWERLTLRTEYCVLLFYKSNSVYSPFLFCST